VRERKDIRLFFALWPDAGLRPGLQHAADSILLARTARRVPATNLHLTLHFIGNVYFDDMACMRSQARLVDAAAFELDIDRQGSFRKPRVAWLGCSEIPDALLALHRQLGSCLQTCGYQPEARPYHPHVTVARKVESIGDTPGFAPLCWRVDSFALIEVQPLAKGVQYRVVESWPLH
jgi:2'-5' RNA ligase